VHIALLHYSVPPVVGGVEAVIGHHARLMAAAGHRVRLIAGQGSEAAEPGIEYALIPPLGSRHPQVLAVKAELDAGRVSSEFHSLSAKLERFLPMALNGIEVLIVHNVASLHKNLALTAALYRLNGKPGGPRFILWHHDLAWTTPRYNSELHEGEPWNLLAQAWPGVKQVAVSEARREELSRLINLAPSEITVIPNGVETERLLKLEPQTVNMVKAMGLEMANPLLLLPVRLTPRKNIELALHVLAALRAGPMPEAMLVVTGPEGPHNPANADYRVKLLELRDALGLAGAAHFCIEHSPDYLPDAVVADFYRLADALFMPSREEGFGIPLLEAALTRLPVFCSDIPPLRALGGTEATYFAPDENPAAVAGKVAERLKADPTTRLAVRVRGEFSWPQIYARHIAPLLNSTIGER
jgi:glycosyltransferase involved in cell wall biosynthesis